jgi:selenocysteine-specific elongation factor
VGGGVVLDAGRRFKRFDARGLEQLRLLEAGGLEDLILSQTDGPQPVPLGGLSAAIGSPAPDVLDVARRLVGEGRLVAVDGGSTFQSPRSFQALVERVRQQLSAYHRRFPLRSGMPREELRQALWPELDGRLAAALLERLAADGVVELTGERVALAGRRVELSPQVAQARQRLLEIYQGAALAPPPAEETLRAAGVGGETAGELLFHLVEEGELIRVDDQFFFSRSALEAAVERVRAFLAEHGQMTVAELRDLLGTTRKYAVPLAEWLDRTHVTRRSGDVRRLA